MFARLKGTGDQELEPCQKSAWPLGSGLEALGSVFRDLPSQVFVTPPPPVSTLVAWS